MKLHRPKDDIPPPRSHQKEALEWMDDREFVGLFMDQGTGKTKTALDRLAELYRRGEIEVGLILAPNGVAAQWIEEQAPEHCSVPYRTILWASNRTRSWKDQTLYTLKKTDGLILVALNWEAIITKDGKNFVEWLIKRKKVAIVADESSRIRNPKAQRTKVALRISPLVKHRMILTGTPVTKGLENLWSQMQFLSPDILKCSTFVGFRSLYCKTFTLPNKRGVQIITGYQRVGELMRKVSPHIFIKRKEDCLDLPEKIYQKSPVPLTPAQETAYQTMRDQLIVQLSELEMVTVAHVLSARAKLRQIAIGFILDENGEATPLHTRRWERALDHLDEAPGKTILWTSFRWCLKQWEEILTKEKIGYVRYAKGDNEAIREWKTRDDIKVFLGNPQSGGIGLNLAEADTMIYFNNSDDLEIRLQSEDRAHRIGQTKHLNIIDLFSPDTVEVKMQRQQKERKSLLQVIMTRGWKDAI